MQIFWYPEIIQWALFITNCDHYCGSCIKISRDHYISKIIIIGENIAEKVVITVKTICYKPGISCKQFRAVHLVSLTIWLSSMHKKNTTQDIEPLSTAFKWTSIHEQKFTGIILSRRNLENQAKQTTKKH